MHACEGLKMLGCKVSCGQWDKFAARELARFDRENGSGSFLETLNGSRKDNSCVILKFSVIA